MKVFTKGNSAQVLAEAQANAIANGTLLTTPATPVQQIAATPTTGRIIQKGPSIPLTLDEYDENSFASYQEPFGLAIWGPAGGGKTRLACTAPGPIGFLPLGRKSKQTALKTAAEMNKKIIMPGFDLSRDSSPMASNTIPNCDPDNKRQVLIDVTREQPNCCTKHASRWQVERTKAAGRMLYEHPRTKAIVVDGYDLFSEDLLNAHFGRNERIQPRDRGPYNKEMVEFLNSFSGKHLILTMGQKEMWAHDKPTGVFDWIGWSNLDYHVNAICQMKFNDTYDENKATDSDGDPIDGYYRWSLNVRMCQANPSITGKAGEHLLTDGAINFQNLALAVYPSSEYAQWV